MVSVSRLAVAAMAFLSSGCAPARDASEPVEHIPQKPGPLGPDSAAARVEISLVRELCKEAQDSAFLPSIRILNSTCGGTFEIGPRGELGRDVRSRFSTMAPPEASAANELVAPREWIFALAGEWPGTAVAASWGIDVVEVMSWSSEGWKRRVVIGDTASFVGFGAWTKGRMITPVVATDGRLENGKLRWSFVKAPEVAVLSAGSAEGLPRLVPDASIAPLGFASFASGDAVLVASARTHEDALEVHVWSGGATEPRVERFDDLIGIALEAPDLPLLARSSAEAYILAERRLPDAPKVPRDRVWREEDPPRHDAMVVLSRTGSSWARTVVDAVGAYTWALAHDEGVWIVPVESSDAPVKLVRVHQTGGQERYELPEVMIEQEQTAVQPLSLLANPDGSLLMLASWGRGLESTTGVFRVRARAPSSAR